MHTTTSHHLKQRPASSDPAPDDFLKAGIGFHGAKNELDALAIQTEGFKSYVIDEDGRWKRDGNLGVGNYFSCDWKMALWFGRVLLQIKLTPGTRILDVRPAANIRVINSLKREFGHELLEGKPIHSVVPHRKNLTQAELIELVRHFYHKNWSGKWNDPRRTLSWPPKRQKAAQALHSAVSLLKKAGFQGYGNPEDDNGVVVWASDRIKVDRIVQTLEPQDHWMLLDSAQLKAMSLNDLLHMRARATYAPAISPHSTGTD